MMRNSILCAVLAAPLYLSATAGLLADAASTGGTTEIAYPVDATRIFVKNL